MPKPCTSCGRRPKWGRKTRCQSCALRVAPIGEQVEAARSRLAMIPEPLRVKRVKAIVTMAPAGTSWCAACQSFRDVEDFGKGATTCRACTSARSHSAMVEKTYGIDAERYAELVKLQDGRCAICGNRPKSKRLAVDHDHKTGAVRGLACAKCNHELLGSAHDSLAMVTAAWHYLNTPPASGAWLPLDQQPRLGPLDAEAATVAPADDIVTFETPTTAALPLEDGVCTRPHAAPAGSVNVPGQPGYWRTYVLGGVEVGAPPF